MRAATCFMLVMALCFASVAVQAERGADAANGRGNALPPTDLQAAGVAAVPSQSSSDGILKYNRRSLCYNTRENQQTIEVGAAETGNLTNREVFTDTSCFVDTYTAPNVDCRCLDPGCGTAGKPACCADKMKPALNWALADNTYLNFPKEGDGWYCRWNRIRVVPNSIVRVTVSYTVLSVP